MKTHHHVIELETGPGVSLTDITGRLRDAVAASGVVDGAVIVTSRHTTTALMINENEARLVDDVRQFLARLAPADAPYLHNDIHLRDCPQDEPENAHSHLIAMLLGSSETVPVVGGALALGTYQSVMLADLDGPRPRTVNVQVMGV